MRWFRELLAACFWAIAITHLFVFDIDVLLLKYLPWMGSVVRYRLPIGLGCALSLWFFLGHQRFLLFFSYMVFYPFVILLWKVPRSLFKNWAVVVAFSPAVHSFTATFRTRVLLLTVALIASLAVCLARPWPLIALGMLGTGVFLISHYIRRFRVAFSPSTVFADIGGAVSRSWETIRVSEWASLPEGDADSEEYKKQYGQNLLSMYFTTAGLEFLAECLNDIVKSRKLDLYFIGLLIHTFALTILIFGIEYFGLERIQPGSFLGTTSPGFWDFLGLSFSTIMTSGISPLKPASSLAQLLSYVQLFGGLLLLVLLVFLILTSIRERYRQDFSSIVDELHSCGDRAAALIEKNYELTITSAEAWLLEHYSMTVRWLLRLKYGEEGARRIPGYSEPVAQEAPPPDSAVAHEDPSS